MDASARDYGRSYFNTVRERYEQYREAAAQQNKRAVMRYYTFAGHEVRVGHVTLDERYGTLLIRGDDGRGNPCDVITSPQNAQVVLRLVPLDEPAAEPDRRPIGFTTAQTEQ